jgi:hypothetical protein
MPARLAGPVGFALRGGNFVLPSFSAHRFSAWLYHAQIPKRRIFRSAQNPFAQNSKLCCQVGPLSDLQ